MSYFLVTGVPPSGAAGGDLSGSFPNPTDVKINGASVPAAGSLTTGNTLQVTGASALSYAPINLAGGANFVTGTLPSGNQASQTLGGDLSGTTGSATVIKIQGNTITSGGLTKGQFFVASSTSNWAATTLSGDISESSSTSGLLTVVSINSATVPAAGSLTTGNVLQVSGASSLAYAAVNLAGGANFVTGVLPTGNQAAQSLGGDLSGTTGSATVIKLQGRNVSASAPTDGQVLAWSATNNDWEPATGSSVIVAGQDYSFSNTSSDIATYDQLLDTATGAEGDLSAAVTSGGGKTLIKSFASVASSPGVSIIPAGLWEFNFYAYVSLLGAFTTTLTFDVYTRTSGGVETLLFSATSGNLTVTSVGFFTLLFNNTTDTYIPSTTRIVIKVSATTTSIASVTAHFVFDGSTHASLVRTPIAGAALQLGGDLSGTTDVATVIKISGASPIAITPANLQWTTGTTTPSLTQADNTTNSATATSLTIQAQNATGTTATGGVLSLTSGTGTTAAGAVTIKTGGTTRLTANATGVITIANLGTGLVHSDSSGNLTSSTLVNADVAAAAAIAVSKLAAGTSAQVLLNNATPTPTWTSISGDISITNAGVVTVTQLQTRAMASTAPNDGQVLAWVAGTSSWTPSNAPTGTNIVGNENDWDNGATYNVLAAKGNATTTDATTAQTMVTYTPTNNSAHKLDITVVGYNTANNNDCYSAQFTLTVVTTSNTPVIVGVNSPINVQTNGSGSTYVGPTVAVSGATITLTTKGAASTTVHWIGAVQRTNVA